MSTALLLANPLHVLILWQSGLQVMTITMRCCACVQVRANPAQCIEPTSHVDRTDGVHSGSLFAKSGSKLD